MKRKQRIEKILSKSLKDINFIIKDNSYLHKGHNNFDGNNETHIMIIIDIQKNNTIDRIGIHREINNLLKIEFENGLHSLEIKINQI